jgi:tRNA-dihydrouridine synthase
MLTIHGRTRREMSKVPAHWDVIGEISLLRDKIAPDTLLVGNGDVESREQGLGLAKKYNLDGIMIGRGIFHDPYIFADHSLWENLDAEQRIALYKKQVQLFAETWKDGERHIQTLNKFCKVYINGFDGAKELRERLMQAKSSEELREILSRNNKLAWVN